MPEVRSARKLTDEPSTGEPRGISPGLKRVLDRFAPAVPAQPRFPPDVSPGLRRVLNQFAPTPPAPPVAAAPGPPGLLEEFGRGVSAGVQRFAPLGAALAGVTADVFGFDEVARDMLEFAQRREEEIFRDLPPTIAFEDAFASPGNFARFALRNLGEQVPVIASIILGGGAGGLIGRLVGRGALSIAEGTAGLSKFGTAAGAVGAATAIETGATATELFGATGEVEPLASFTAGIAKGALEAVVPLAFARRFGLGVGEAKGILDRATSFLDRIPTRPRRIAAGFGAGGVVEGATEFLQEAVDVAVRDFVDDNFDAMDPEVRMRLLESATVGAIVGMIFGGIGGAVGGRPTAQETPLGERLPLGEGEGLAPATPLGEGVPPVSPTPNVPPPAPAPAGPLPTAVPETSPVAPGPPSPQTEEVPPAAPSPAPLPPDIPTKIFRGEGREVRGAAFTDVDVSILGKGKYFAFTQEDAETFGPNVETKTIDLKSPLIIRSGQEWRALTREAGWGFPNPTGQPKAQVEAEVARLNALVRARGHDGVVVWWDNSIEGDVAPDGANIKLLRNVFGIPQVFEIEAEPAVTREDVLAAAKARVVPTAALSTFSDIAERVFPDGKETSLKDARARLEALIAAFPDTLDFLPDLKELSKSEFARRRGEILRALRRVRLGSIEGVPTDETAKDLLKTRVSDVLRAGLIVRNPSAEIPLLLDTNLRVTDEEYDAAARNNFTVKGKLYNSEAHPDGTVQVASALKDSYKGLSVKGRKSLRRVEAALNDLLKLFGMTDVKMLLAIDAIHQTGETLILDENTGGAASGSSRSAGRVHIVMSTRALERGDPVQLATLVAHEFGHILTWSEFIKASPSVQLKLINAYTRRVTKASLGTREDFAAALATADRAELLLSVVDNFTPAMQSSLVNDPAYWFGFSEFLAEHVARWLTTRPETLSPLDRIFKGLAKDLRLLYRTLAKKFGINPTSFRADEDVAAWLESLAQGRALRRPEVLGAAVEKGLQDSRAENSKILGDAATPASEMSDSVMNLASRSGVSQKQAKKVKAGVDRINWLLKWGASIRQLTLLNPHIVGLRIYNELMDAWNNAATQWKSRANETLTDWRALSRQSQENLAKFIFDVDSMSYVKEGEEARQPTQDELLALARKHKLTTEAYQAFQQIRTDLNDFLTAIQDVLERDITDTIDNEILRDFKIGQVRQEFDRLRQRPYFPHSRFGDFTVIVKKEGKTVHAEQFATRKEARNALRRVKAAFKEEEGFLARVDKIPEEARPFRGLPPALLQQLKTLPGLTEQQKIWIEQLVVELSPAQSFRKRLARRKDIPGFSLDAMRSYANYFWHGSNYLARIQFQRPLQEAINSVSAEASDPDFALTQPGQDVSQRRRIADFMQQHMDQIMNPAPDWAQLRSIAFMWWLGFAPQSAILNLTQVPMVAWPYLAARYGNAKSAEALRKAMGAIPRMMRRKTEDVSDGFLKGLTQAVEEGVVDESYATELAATSEGANLTGLLPGYKVQRGMMKIAHWSAFLFQMSEKLNRRTVFAAGWELATKDPSNPVLQELKELNTLEYRKLLQQGFSEQEALSYLAARDAVWSTQFQYSNHARARFMRGRKGVVFTFFTFVQSMVFFAAHDRGRIQFYLMMFVLAGMMGLPFAEDVFAVARFAARKFLGKDFDIEKATREFVVEVMGEDSISPDLILHGISRVGFGIPAAADLLGVPFPKFDLSASVSMGRIIPGLSELGPPQRNFDAMFARASTDIAGAAFGIGINAMKFLSDSELPYGDSKRWERAIPRAAKNLLRANRFLSEGRERTRTGATVLDFDASDPDQLAEIIGQALGFTPTRLSRKWDRERMKQEAITFWTIRRSMLLKQFDHASVVGDSGARADVLAAIRRYNNEVALPGFKISGKELRQSRRARSRSRRLFEAGLPTQKRARPLARSIDRLHPEAREDVDVEDVSRMR